MVEKLTLKFMFDCATSYVYTIIVGIQQDKNDFKLSLGAFIAVQR